MIPHNKPSIGLEESAAVSEVIASGWIAPGEKVKQFEQVFADYVGAKYVIAVNSGTAALTIALHILESKEVVIPTYCCAAILNAITLVKAVPILGDISKDDFNISTEPSIYANTVIVPHTFGVPCRIIKFGREPYIIEDCSQALGSRIDGQHVGLQGDIGIFSFSPSKMITTGSGGMIVTNNKVLADKAREFIDYDKHIPAFNYGMNDLQAAMGLAQLKKLPVFLRRRHVMAIEYMLICDEKGWMWQAQNGQFYEKNHYRFVIIDDCVSRLKQHLADNGITAIVPIEPHELLHNMLGLDSKQYPNAEYIAGHSLSLPIFPALTDEEFNHIIDTLRRF
jgi:perosamine synthetase